MNALYKILDKRYDSISPIARIEMIKEKERKEYHNLIRLMNRVTYESLDSVAFYHSFNGAIVWPSESKMNSGVL